MIKCKGVYEWKLVNATTGETEAEGKQDNVVTDDFLYMMSPNTDYDIIYRPTGNIILSEVTLPVDLGGHDVRRTHHANNKYPRTNESGFSWPAINLQESSFTYSKNFNPTPAGVTYTYSAISLEMRPNNDNHGGYRTSVIELSTPITHNDNQYLYITYKMYIQPEVGGQNMSNNSYITKHLQNEFINMGYYCFIPSPNSGNDFYEFDSCQTNNDWNYQSRYEYGINSSLTRLLPAVDVNNIGRNPYITYDSLQTRRYNRNEWNANRSKFGMLYGREYEIDRLHGPVGTIVYRPQAGSGHSDAANGFHNNRYRYDKVILGQSPIEPTPSISRNFTHASNRIGQRFNDAAYPPETRGKIVFGGTPTNKVSTTMHMLYDNSGKAIDVDDGEQGSYKLGLNAYEPGLLDFNEAMFPMYKDLEKTQPAELSNDVWYSLAYTQTHGTWQYDNKIWSLTQQKPTDEFFSITNWETYTVETCVIKGQFESHIDGTRQRITGVVLGTGTYDGFVYIGTDKNIYRYDMNNPDSPVVKLSITGVILNSTNEITWDDVTETLWVYGSINDPAEAAYVKIDPATLAGTPYTYIGSDFETNADFESGHFGAWPGAITVKNGVIAHGGAFGTFYTTRSNTSYYHHDPSNLHHAAWLYDTKTDESNMIYNSANCRGSILLDESNFAYYSRSTSTDVNNTGNFHFWQKNSGTGVWEEIKVINDGHKQRSQRPYFDYWSQLVKISDNRIGIVIGDNNNSTSNSSVKIRVLSVNLFDDSTNIYYVGAHGGYISNYSPFSNHSWSLSSWYGPKYMNSYQDQLYTYYNTSRNTYMFDGICPVIPFRKVMIRDMTISTYGWDGTKWELDNPNSRPITDSAPHELLYGVTADFNNSTGVVWDKQFVTGEDTCVTVGQLPVKDNLQKFDLRWKYYWCKAEDKVHNNFIIPDNTLSGPWNSFNIPEVSDPNFRDLDSDWYAHEKGIGYELSLSADGTPLENATITSDYVVSSTRLADLESGFMNVSEDMPTGTMLIIYPTTSGSTTINWNNTYLPSPLSWDYPDYVYAINVSPTQIQLAKSYEDAINGVPMVLTHRSNSSYSHSNHRAVYRTITIEPGKYAIWNTGKIWTHPTDAGKEIDMSYTCTYYS